MHPDKLAIDAGGERLSYAELESRARSAAGALLELGISAGNRVGLALPSGPELVAALHGCMLAGAVAVPIDLRLGQAERAARSAGARPWSSRQPARRPGSSRSCLRFGLTRSRP